MFFHGDASKASIVTAKRLREQLEAVERDIAAYGEALDANDPPEAADATAATSGCGMTAKMRALLECRAARQADLA